MAKKSILKPLHELAPDDKVVDCFALLSEKNRGITQTGKPYYTCRFRDANRVVTSMIWSDTSLFDECEIDWQVGQFYKIRGQYKEHEKYGSQFELTKLRPIEEGDAEEGFDPVLLVEATRFNTDEMFEELLELVNKHIEDNPLQKLTLKLLNDHAEAFKRLPATQIRFFPFLGGLLEHTLSVTRNCIWLVDRYRDYYTELTPPLNKNLVIAGAVLHDIGRVLELEPEGAGTEQTISGRMMGHLILGRDLIRDTAREQGDVNPQLLEMLEHIVLSHLTIPKWGSVRLPLIPECIILHHADDLDAKLEMYVRCLSRDLSPGPFTEREPSLERSLFKGREV